MTKGLTMMKCMSIASLRRSDLEPQLDSVEDVGHLVDEAGHRARILFAVAEILREYLAHHGEPPQRRLFVDGTWVVARRDVVDELRVELIQRAGRARREEERLLGRKVLP